MNHAVRKTFAALSLAGAALANMASAHAGGVDWHIGINLPGVFYPAPPVVYGPPPVVYSPPPRVIYRPAPIVYQAPVYGYPAERGERYEGRGHDRRWHHDHHGRHGGWDRHRHDRHDDRHDDRRGGHHGRDH